MITTQLIFFDFFTGAGDVVPPDIISGPFRTVAAYSYTSGAESGRAYSSGAESAEAYTSGAESAKDSV